MKTSCFVYLRVSGQGQVSGDGFPRQLEACRKYADAHNLRIAKVFREEGVSGTKDLENRPALQDLLLALHSNGTRVIIIERLDRLARDLLIQESILGDFRKHGFELISTAEPDLNSEDPSRTLMRQFFGAIAQYEKTVLVQKLRGARQRQRAKNGSCEGRKPYGFRNGEQPILESMKTLRESGLGVDRIAAKFNQEGKTTRSGGLWYGATVNKILRANEVVTQN